MNVFTLFALVAFGAFLLKSREQKTRIALLAEYLGQFQIEKMMENLTEGYLRALGENNPERSAQIWNMLASTELGLTEQFDRFAVEFSKVDADRARVSKLGFAVAYADKIFPGATFDMRKALTIHAQGIARAIQGISGQSQKDKAFMVSAELFLMQHTCHWFCRSKTVASARMLALHKTPYTQLVQSVSPQTRKAYQELVGA